MQPFDPALYGDRIADVYDDLYAGATDVEGTVAMLRGLGSRMLELGVGTGRLAIPLVEAGCEVHGVDASTEMVARLRAKPRGDEVVVTVGDFAELAGVGDRFDVVVLPFNALFNLPTDERQRRCLQRCAEVVRPGGHVVVEAVVPADDPVGNGVSVRDVSADRVLLSAFRREGDLVTGSLVSISEAGGVRLHPWQIRPVAPEEVDAMAAAAGLALVRRDAGWRGEPFDDLSDRHVTVYQRDGR